MPDVEICINGASVKLSATEASAEQLGQQALDLLREAAALNPAPSGPVGFAQAERRDTPPVQPSAMWAAPGPYPIQVRGEETT